MPTGCDVIVLCGANFFFFNRATVKVSANGCNYLRMLLLLLRRRGNAEIVTSQLKIDVFAEHATPGPNVA